MRVCFLSLFVFLSLILLVLPLLSTLLLTSIRNGEDKYYLFVFAVSSSRGTSRTLTTCHWLHSYLFPSFISHIHLPSNLLCETLYEMWGPKEHMLKLRIQGSSVYTLYGVGRQGERERGCMGRCHRNQLLLWVLSFLDQGHFPLLLACILLLQPCFCIYL